MDEDAGNFVALAETTVFLSCFKDMPDFRQAEPIKKQIHFKGTTIS